MSEWHLLPPEDGHVKSPVCACRPTQHFESGVWLHNFEADPDSAPIDQLNQQFQDKLYELIDSKADGLKDCTVTEIIEVAAQVLS